MELKWMCVCGVYLGVYMSTSSYSPVAQQRSKKGDCYWIFNIFWMRVIAKVKFHLHVLLIDLGRKNWDWWSVICRDGGQKAPAVLLQPGQSAPALAPRKPTCAVDTAALWPRAATCGRRPFFFPHQSAWFTVLELTCEQLFFQSIMSTVEALCAAKKRPTCQNCDVKVPYFVSQCQGRFLGQVIVMCECCHVCRRLL